MKHAFLVCLLVCLLPVSLGARDDKSQASSKPTDNKPAPFFLFMHGKDITIPKGAEVTAHVNGDVKLDLARYQHLAAPESGQGAVAADAVPPVVSTMAKLQLESDPSPADIEIDGNFVGNTPSDLQVSEGTHTVSVKKSGFKAWEKILKVNAGATST